MGGLLAVLALAAGLVVPSPVDPIALPQGPVAQVPVLVDGVIDTPGGSITPRLPDGHRAQVLMGEVDGEYVVGADDQGATEFWSVTRDGSVRALGPPRAYYNASPMMGAGRILVSESDRGTVLTKMAVVDARTGATLMRRQGTALIPLSIGRRGVVYAVGATSNSVRLWGFDGSDRELFTTGSDLLVPGYVGLKRSLVVNEDIAHDDYRLAVTGLDDPDGSRWSVPEGRLLATSPSGEYVVLDPSSIYGDDTQQSIEVRRLSDGALVSRIAFTRHLAWSEAAFDDATHFVMPMHAGARRQVLVRCSITGGCARAGEPGRSIRLQDVGER